MTALSHLTRRRILQASAAGVFVATAPGIVRAQSKTLFANTYGGVLEQSWAKAFFTPFTAQTGIPVKTVSPVSFAKLKAQVQTKNYEWNVTALGESEFAEAMHEGLLEKVDLSLVHKDKVPPGVVLEYGAGNYSLGTNICYRKDKFPNGGPQSWADFWDVKKFPGSRCFYDRSFTCLAFALLADGVPIDKLYPMDLDRAFKKMSEIKPHVKVFWTQGNQSQQLIRDGEVDMIAIWSARAYDLIDTGVPLEVVWNQAENYGAYWCVPKGDPNASVAWQFVDIAIQPKPQADFTTLLPYGPMNPDAVPLVPPERAKLTPSYPDNAKISFRHDSAWLAPRLGQIRERWTQWLTT